MSTEQFYARFMAGVPVPGPQGPQGDPGPQGPPGPQGAAGVSSQTPWASDVDAAGFALNNCGVLSGAGPDGAVSFNAVEDDSPDLSALGNNQMTFRYETVGGATLTFFVRDANGVLRSAALNLK